MLLRQGGCIAQPEIALWGIANSAHGIGMVRCHHALHSHFVARQRAGFVSADHGNRAEGFHRRQSADDCIAPRHALHADSQGNGHDRRQSLRNGRHRQPDHGQEHVCRSVIAPAPADGEHRSGDRQDDDSQPLGKAGHFRQQRCGHLLHFRQQCADVANFSTAADGDHDAFAQPVSH
jgi:hypothetical protein